MKCLDLPLKYIGQTGRIFSIIYKEHIHAIRNNNNNPNYILNIGHTYDIITDIMDVIRTGRKGRHLNTFKNITLIK
jgi:hypothetical protein